MKKFLSILASLTIITSSATGVIACGTTTENKAENSSTIANNNAQNLLGAAFNEAKAIIIDNHYKISPKLTNEVFKDLEAKALINDYQSEGDLTDQSTLQDVIHQYFGSATSYNPKEVDDKFSLNNTKGLISGLDD